MKQNMCWKMQVLHIAPSASIQPASECLLYARYCVEHKWYRAEMVAPLWSLNSSGRRQTIKHPGFDGCDAWYKERNIRAGL